MLARTKLLTFILSFVIIFSILVTLFSSNGYMVNRDLRKYAENLDSDIERKRAEIDMLRAEGERTLLSENFLPLNGEKIIAVSEVNEAELNTSYDTNDVPYERFRPLSMSLIAFIGLCLASAITFITDLYVRRRKNGKPDNREK